MAKVAPVSKAKRRETERERERQSEGETVEKHRINN